MTLIAALGLGACGPDAVPFGIALELDREPGQMCPSDVCENIPMSCDAAVQIRIVDNSAETPTWYSECFHVESTGNLCALDNISIPSPLVENGLVRIQIAIWPYGPDTANCPVVHWASSGTTVEPVFDPDNPPPAIAGQAYFDVGSGSLATVVLGCLDYEALDADACKSTGTVAVMAGVTDFDTNVSVSPTVQNLIVAVGEPAFDGATWSMPSSATAPLDRDVIAGVPVWEGDVDLTFGSAACIQVFEDSTGPVTATLSCRPASPDDTALDLGGVLVRKATLDVVQAALGGGFPPGGLVLGRVLDHTGQPAVGARVLPSSGATVLYLSDDMTAISAGAITTTSGAFVSLDAPFDTTWSAEFSDTTQIATEVEVQLGGRVTGKVTVIELQLTDPVTKG